LIVVNNERGDLDFDSSYMLTERNGNLWIIERSVASVEMNLRAESSLL